MANIIRLPKDLKDHDPYFQECITKATVALKNGDVIALPTDTIYGIAVLAQSTQAVEKLYKIKGRHSEKPIAISVGNVRDLQIWGEMTVKEELLSHLLPGAVTLIFNRTSVLNQGLNPFTSQVGVRIPDHPFVRQLAISCGEPLALTSANKSASKSSLNIEEFQELWHQLAFVFDGGTVGDSDECRKGSTVVNLATPGTYQIIRDGRWVGYIGTPMDTYNTTDYACGPANVAGARCIMGKSQFCARQK